MATTDYDFIASRNDIMQRAFRMVGALPTGQSLSGEQYQQGALALNEIVKSWQSKRIFLWTLKSLTLNLSAGVASYSLSNDPAVIAIDQAFVQINTDEDRPVRIISWREYQTILDKTDTGDPYYCTIDNQPTPTLYVYPVQTATRVFKYTAITRLQDFDSATSNGGIPVRFQECLTYSLAEALSDEYGVAISERERYERKAKELFREASRSDRDRADYEFVDGAF